MQGDVSFDNIGRALLQVLQVVSLESWSSSQMYHLLDGIGSVVVVYYFCLIVIGTYFALNLLVAVISAKFAQLHVRTKLASYQMGSLTGLIGLQNQPPGPPPPFLLPPGIVLTLLAMLKLCRGVVPPACCKLLSCK